MVIITCPCGRKISTSLYRAKRKKYCSKKCFYQFRIRPSGLKYNLKSINKGWFKKGKSSWNSGTKGIMKSNSTSFKQGELTGAKNNKWEGDNVGYSALHYWLQRTYGKANHCENRKNNILKFECSKESKNYNWALIKGKKYKRKRENFIMLCHSCHLKDDKNKGGNHV